VAPSSANPSPACQDLRPRLPWSITGDAIELFLSHCLRCP
jgi:hypothetical protein